MPGKDQESKVTLKIQGTREWAVAEVNCSRGCPRGCLYCYARHALVQQKSIADHTEWLHCQPDARAVAQIQKKYQGQVMFPAAYDIVSENVKGNCSQAPHLYTVADSRIEVL